MKLKKRESLGKKIAIGMSLINLANVVGPFSMLTTDISVPGGHVYADNDMHGTSVNLPGEMGGYVQTMLSPRVAYADSKSIAELPDSGGTKSVTVGSGGTQTIGTMKDNGREDVSSGGTGTVSTMSGGQQYIYQGGTGIVSTMNGGTQYVSSGNTLDVSGGTGEVEIMHGGTQIVNAHCNGTIGSMYTGRQSGDGTMSVGTMHGGTQQIGVNGTGTISAMNGGTQIGRGTMSVTTMNGGTQTVSKKGTIDTMNGGSQKVLSGGNGTVNKMHEVADTETSCWQGIKSGATGTIGTMYNGGTQTVYAGGNGTVSTMSGGSQTVDGVFDSESLKFIIGTGTIVNMNGGTQTVNGGTGIVEKMNGGTTDETFCLQEIKGGGATGSGIVKEMSGGTQTVYAGASGTVETMSGGTQNVSGGPSAFDKATGTISTMIGGVQNVAEYCDGTVTIMKSGTQKVFEDGNGIITTMNGGTQTVSAGGTGTVSTLSGGIQEISAGGTSKNTVVTGSGTIIENNGAKIDNLKMNGGTWQLNSGVTKKEQAVSGYKLNVQSGAVANGCTVSAKGLITVDGGKTSGTIINYSGVEEILAGGISENAYISSGGKQRVSSGGNGTAGTMEAGGEQMVYADGSGTVTTMSGGEQTVLGGSGTVTTMISGSQSINSSGTGTVKTMKDGLQDVDDGCTGMVTTMNGGKQTVSAGGTGTVSTLSGGIQEISAGGTSKNTVVTGSGTIIENNGAKIDNLKMNGGTWQLNSGVNKEETLNVSGYTLNVQSGAKVTNLTVENGVANVAVLDGGTQTVSSGGTVTVTTMSGGKQYVSAGGTGTVTTMNDGEQIVSSGGSGMIDKMAGGTQILEEGAAGSIKEVTSTGKVVVELKGNNSFTFPEKGVLCLNSLQNKDALKPSTIDVYGKGHTISTDLAVPGNKLNFYIPNTAEKNDVMINVTSTADITGATVKAGVQDGTTLKNQDTIILIKAGTLKADNITTGKLEDAGFAAWDLDIAANDNKLTAVVKNREPDMEKAKIFAETRAGGAALLNTAVNLMIGEGMEGAMAAADEADSQATAGQNDGGASSGGFTPYAAIGGNSMRYETGSYVDSDGWGINVGFSRKLRYEKHTLTLAPLVEYGKANYASHLDDGTRGDGSNQFLGIGCIVRDEQNDGMYYEGSLRVGRMKGDYRGEANSSYDTASNYLGFHAGIGKVLKYQDNKLDIYGKFFWSRQGGDDVVITSDSGAANYTFDAINSYRMRIGTRWTQQIATRQAVYMGAAWDYEFDSEARAVYHAAGGDFGTPSPSMKGSSGMFELGWKYQAAKKDPLSVNLGLTGWFGKQRGLQFTGGFAWEF